MRWREHVRPSSSERLYVIRAGSVRVFRHHSDGREKTLAMLGPGEVLGEMTVFGSERRSASAETVAPTTFFVMLRPRFRELLADIPNLAVQVIETLSTRLRDANQQIHELAFVNSRGRVICGLGRLAGTRGSVGPTEGEILIPITHAELAKIASVSRETTTKILTELAEKGLVRAGHGRLWITDIGRLYDELST